jgi:hypothetical protein
MKSLFNEYDTYTELAIEIDKEVSEFAKQLISKYPDVNHRDIFTVAAAAINMECTHARVIRQLKLMRENKNEM